MTRVPSGVSTIDHTSPLSTAGRQPKTAPSAALTAARLSREVVLTWP